MARRRKERHESRVAEKNNKNEIMQQKSNSVMECNSEKEGGLGWVGEERREEGKKVGWPCQADCFRAMSQKQA